MAPKTNQFEYNFNKDKPLPQSNGLVYSKNVRFEKLPNFETVVKFTIKANSTPPYDGFLSFFIDPVESNPATRGNLGSEGSHDFRVRFGHDSNNLDYLNLVIIIDTTKRCSVPVPNEFLGKELTLTASYVANTQEIKVSITDGSKPFQVILAYDLGPILKDLVEIGLFKSPGNVDVSYWQTNQLKYDFNKDKPLQKGKGLVYSKKVRFEQFPNFETVVKFTIAPNDRDPCRDFLGFYIDPVGFTSAGKHAFGFLFDHNSDDPDYLKLEIFIDNTSRSSVLVPNEFLGKELTLTASYVADTQEIKVSITDGSKPFQVILYYDLGLILIKDHVEVGLFIPDPSNVVVVRYWHFN